MKQAQHNKEIFQVIHVGSNVNSTAVVTSPVIEGHLPEDWPSNLYFNTLGRPPGTGLMSTGLQCTLACSDL